MSGVSFLPLGGLGYIGLNGLLVEVGDHIYLVDCGIEFPEENEPGVDTVLPDLEFIQSLEGRLKGHPPDPRSRGPHWGSLSHLPLHESAGLWSSPRDCTSGRAT